MSTVLESPTTTAAAGGQVGADGLVVPHGGTLVDLTVTGSAADALRAEAEALPVITLSERETADLEMMAVGALSPLTGFVGSADYERIVTEARLANGTLWPFPVTLAVAEVPAASRVALAAPDGALLAVMDITESYGYDREREAELVYGTTDPEHPGVAMLHEQADTLLAGPVQVFGARENVHGAHLQTPAQLRATFATRGWKTVVAFQTRNPIHRAHEYIVKTAMETVDGLLLHPLVGRTKEGDISAEVRMRCYDVLLEQYFPSDRVQLAVYPAAMRYAGPREALWHALTRKNYGASHFIVGRDHAGVGSYYTTYEAQEYVLGLDRDELGIQIMPFEHSFFCLRCEGMASAKTCPHDPASHVHLSGTKVREMLGNGEIPPVEFSRPEVAQILIDSYRA